MARSSEGPLETVGWGPFPLFGERMRLEEAERRRVAAVFKAAAIEESYGESRPLEMSGQEVDSVDTSGEEEWHPFRSDPESTEEDYARTEETKNVVESVLGDLDEAIVLVGHTLLIKHRGRLLSWTSNWEIIAELVAQPTVMTNPEAALKAIDKLKRSSLPEETTPSLASSEQKLA